MVSRTAFFSGAGELVCHEVKVEAGFTGTRADKDVPVVTFTYEQGVARYDGEGWAFALNEVAVPREWEEAAAGWEMMGA